MKNWIFYGAMLALNFSFLNTAQAEEANVKAARTTVVIETTQGSFEVTLFPDIAPKAVENFLKHASDHYYDGTIFHRVIPGFMIQGGDPKSNGTGGESIWENRLKMK